MDAVTIAVKTPNADLIALKVNSALKIVIWWMTDDRLDLAPDKTNAVKITKEWIIVIEKSDYQERVFLLDVR